MANNLQHARITSAQAEGNLEATNVTSKTESQLNNEELIHLPRTWPETLPEMGHPHFSGQPVAVPSYINMNK